jgi:predicted dehydrogenase
MTHDAPVRVAAIGCGQFMRQQHIQTIARSNRLRLHALVDLDAQRLAEVAARYRPLRATTGWEEAVADPEVDVVVVAVRPEFHAEIARAALGAGKPVYVEKPLAPTPDECRAIHELAHKRGLPVAVGFNRRFAPATLRLREAFRAVGAPASIYYRISDDGRIRPPEQAWKNEDRLLIEAVHMFDLFAYSLQSEPVQVYARETRPNDAWVLLEFANGSRAGLLSSSYGSLAQPKEHLEAVLAHGAVEMDDFVEFRSFGVPGVPAVEYYAGRAYDGCDNRHVEEFARRGLAALREFRERYARAAEESGVLANSADPAAWSRFRQMLGDPPLPQVNYASDKGWGAALEHFCSAAVEGRIPANATAIDGNRATACAVAARRSIQTGQPVDLDPRAWGTAKEC